MASIEEPVLGWKLDVGFPFGICLLEARKFADAFTRNFDLVAERKSVVFHLRELAKASVMAKYLVDSNIRVSSSWYQLADEMLGPV
jgi:hypothetical protein